VVINKDGSAPINALVHKTSAGAINSLKIFHVTNLSRAIVNMQKRGVWVIGMVGTSKSTIYDVNLTDATAIVMGSEGKGVRRLIKETCDQIVTIPMSGNIESLNVSVATGIALFESKRQREST
jgi:23S rRNA (guanosine2251-2'-O)-methyltransferase